MKDLLFFAQRIAVATRLAGAASLVVAFLYPKPLDAAAAVWEFVLLIRVSGVAPGDRIIAAGAAGGYLSAIGLGPGGVPELYE